MDLIEQIQQQIVARLAAAATFAGDSVEADRSWPLAPEEEPFDALLVHVGQDQVVESTPMRPRRITLDLEVNVRAISRVASENGLADPRARALALQVKQALLGAAADVTLGGIAKGIRYAGSTGIEDETNLGAAGREITFIVRFQTSETSFEAST